MPHIVSAQTSECMERNRIAFSNFGALYADKYPKPRFRAWAWGLRASKGLGRPPEEKDSPKL